jgi:hypothetical protein
MLELERRVTPLLRNIALDLGLNRTQLAWCLNQ